MQNQTILVVEDDIDINNLLQKILKKEGYQVIQAFSGTEAQLRLDLQIPDMIILDLMIPGMRGDQFIKYVRDVMQCSIPILVLSAVTSLESKVELLKTGADDYMTKPFEPQEVLARVYAALRRSTMEGHGEDSKRMSYPYKNILLFPDSRTVTVCGRLISLTKHEYDILFLLLQNPDKVFAREHLYEAIWQNGYYGEDNTVNVHISNIRKKIAFEDAGEEYIKTVWGIGFKMA